MIKIVFTVLVVGIVGVMIFLAGGFGDNAEYNGVKQPMQWREVQTEVQKGGVFSLVNKDWYEEALRLSEGAQLTRDLDCDGDPDVLVMKDGNALVMIIDDNDTMSSLNPHGDRIDDCWVVDLDNDGLVDRMIDYIDNEGDGIVDEMEIRYFQKGLLRWGWFWEDRDHDGLMWDVENYGYGSPWKSDMMGDNLFYSNKYNSETDEWLPIGECPFSFYDLNGDRSSESVIRFCAAPGGADFQTDIDYANNLAHYWADDALSAPDSRLINIRMSFSLLDSKLDARPYKYNCGITLVGSELYDNLQNFKYFNPRRRSPKVTTRIPWEQGHEVVSNYSAVATGFSWDEMGAYSRWEGVFWIWERRIIPNTGGWTAKYNIRREYDGDCSHKRQLYYSSVDRRIHLLGAEEGWIEVGDLFEGQEGRLGEIRYFDTDNDGYFDRWEIDLNNDSIPDRVSSIPNPGVKLLPWDYSALKEFYTNNVLKAAIQSDLKMITALRAWNISAPEADNLIPVLEERIDSATSEESKRYLLDILRELYYASVMKYLRAIEYSLLPDPYGADAKYESGKLNSSVEYWSFAKRVTEFDVAYSAGHFDEAIDTLETLADAVLKN